MHDTGYDYRYDDYDYPLVAQWDARDLDELAVLFEQGFEDVPFTAAEEEMLPVDPSLWTPCNSNCDNRSH